MNILHDPNVRKNSEMFGEFLKEEFESGTGVLLSDRFLNYVKDHESFKKDGYEFLLKRGNDLSDLIFGFDPLERFDPSVAEDLSNIGYGLNSKVSDASMKYISVHGAIVESEIRILLMDTISSAFRINYFGENLEKGLFRLSKKKSGVDSVRRKLQSNGYKTQSLSFFKKDSGLNYSHPHGASIMCYFNPDSFQKAYEYLSKTYFTDNPTIRRKFVEIPSQKVYESSDVDKNKENPLPIEDLRF